MAANERHLMRLAGWRSRDIRDRDGACAVDQTALEAHRRVDSATGTDDPETLRAN